MSEQKKCVGYRCDNVATHICRVPGWGAKPKVHITHWCKSCMDQLKPWDKKGTKWSLLSDEAVKKSDEGLLPCLLCGQTPTWYEGCRGKVSLWHTCSKFFEVTVHFKLGDKQEHIKRWNERMRR